MKILDEEPDGLSYRNLPEVALVGRPNVGKSTLFNRLLHKRRAITDPTPGVTRDPVAMETLLAGKPVKLIDTGGFKLVKEARSAARDIDALVKEKTLETLEHADLIVLMLAAGELTCEDEEFIALLRPFQTRLLVAVNKTEGGRLEEFAWNLLAYGFDKVYPISAEHGDRVGELTEAIVARLDFSRVITEDDATRPIRVAILGKPNTGKSTLSNRLTASTASIVSDVPGTTRDVVEGFFPYKRRDFIILDTAGIRRKPKVTENIEYYSVNRAIKTIDEADMVFLMIDALDGFSEQDKKIAALACDKGRGVIMALNKWDAMPDVKNAFEAVSDRIRFFFGQMEYAPIMPLSAKDGAGADKLLDMAIHLYGELTHRVETGAFNQALIRWQEEFPPPAGNARFKIKYGAQVTANPVKFVLFVSRPKAVTEPYLAYIRNRVRKDLGFTHIPITLEVRASRKDWDKRD
ncbi:MAG: ribosome biogenesis GTPase Der [Treponema sp.]|nr:ribosome biogenesis GTPase Der [Treponema sp.]